MGMTKSERVQAAINGNPVDRPPVSFWKHYHLQDQAPGLLAEITVKLQQKFDTDLVKLMPSGLYAIQDWGAGILFARNDTTKPRIIKPVITSTKDWPELPELDVWKGALRKQLEMIAQVDEKLDDVPFIMTAFSPLTIAYKLRGGQFSTKEGLSGELMIQDLRQSPDNLHQGLDTISNVVSNFMSACREAGASGFFFATQMANHNDLTEEEYKEFGVRYDKPILEEFQDTEVTMLHACRENIMFDLVSDYPVDIINWADRDNNPSLAEARQKTDKTLAGGLSLDTLLNGSGDEVENEVLDAIDQVGKDKLIIAPGCVIKSGTSDANLEAARSAVGSLA